MASAAPPENPIVLNIATTYGCILIGSWLSSIVWGVSCAQTFLYLSNYWDKDSWVKKGLVIFLWFVDTADEILILQPLWHVLIANFGDIQILSQIQPELTHRGWVTALVAFCVQLFFVHRIYVFSGNKWILPAFLTILSIFQLVVLIPYDVLTWASSHTTSGIQESWATDIIMALRSVTAAEDIIIAGTMIFLVLRHGLPHYRSTRRMVYRLILVTFMTGFWTAVVGIVELAMVARFPATLQLMVPDGPLSGLYFSSLLANLNSRGFVKGEDFSCWNDSEIEQSKSKSKPSDATSSGGNRAGGMVFRVWPVGSKTTGSDGTNDVSLTVKVNTTQVSDPNALEETGSLDDIRYASKGGPEVVFLWCVDTANEILLLEPLWHVLIANFGGIRDVSKIQPALTHHGWVAGIVAFCVQLFFVHRIYQFSRRQWILPAFLTLLSLFQLIVLIPYDILTLSASHTTAGIEHAWATDITISLRSVTAAEDIIIAASMIFLVLKEGLPEFRSTRRMVYRLILVTFNTGFWTAVVAIVELAMVAHFPDGLQFMVLEAPLCSLYFTSLLANLNSREFIKGDHFTSWNDSELSSNGNGRSRGSHSKVTSSSTTDEAGLKSGEGMTFRLWPLGSKATTSNSTNDMTIKVNTTQVSDSDVRVDSLDEMRYRAGPEVLGWRRSRNYALQLAHHNCRSERTWNASFGGYDNSSIVDDPDAVPTPVRSLLSALPTELPTDLPFDNASLGSFIGI
ncbi:hypothetical protein DENSPDRAFT_932493 [Dentipellis sp. KUC8613]|nr:hypothetical protein DENSPDRAFT_932493 [Dentipellis sp. KUC8613]